MHVCLFLFITRQLYYLIIDLFNLLAAGGLAYSDAYSDA
jgi:hypothetical protein